MPAATLLQIALVSHVARAGQPGTACEDARVRIHGQLGERWLEPIVRLCEELVNMPDSDRTARVRIVPAGHDLVVEVVLADGRATVRRVQDPARLMPTLEALLAVPPTGPALPSTAPPVPAAPPAHDPTPKGGAPSPVPPPSVPGVEMGANVGGRGAAQGYISAASTLFALVRIRDWLFEMHARWDIVQHKSNVAVSRFEMETVGAGLSLARRFPAMFGQVDLGVTSCVLSDTQSFQARDGEKTGTQTEVRIGAFARAILGRATSRLFVELDADVSPVRLRRTIYLDPALPALPAWSAGLAAGLIWGEQ